MFCKSPTQWGQRDCRLIDGCTSAWLVSFTTPYFINSKELNWGAKVSLSRHVLPFQTHMPFS